MLYVSQHPKSPTLDIPVTHKSTTKMKLSFIVASASESHAKMVEARLNRRHALLKSLTTGH